MEMQTIALGLILIGLVGTILEVFFVGGRAKVTYYIVSLSGRIIYSAGITLAIYSSQLEGEMSFVYIVILLICLAVMWLTQGLQMRNHKEARENREELEKMIEEMEK